MSPQGYAHKRMWYRPDVSYICLNIVHSVMRGEDKHNNVSGDTPGTGFCLTFMKQTEDVECWERAGRVQTALEKNGEQRRCHSLHPPQGGHSPVFLVPLGRSMPPWTLFHLSWHITTVCLCSLLTAAILTNALFSEVKADDKTTVIMFTVLKS